MFENAGRGGNGGRVGTDTGSVRVADRGRWHVSVRRGGYGGAATSFHHNLRGGGADDGCGSGQIGNAGIRTVFPIAVVSAVLDNESQTARP